MVPCEVKPVTEVMNCDPPHISLMLIHELFEQFGNTGIPSHACTPRNGSITMEKKNPSHDSTRLTTLSIT
ncbi:MAG: hypothetical protein WCP36_04785 [Methanomicrobiales archaeon]